MSEQAPEFNQYVRAVTSRLWLVVVLVVLAVGAAYWQTGRAPAQYTASAVLLVAAPVITPPPAVAAGGDNGFWPSIGIVSNDVLQLLSSRPIAERVAKRLNIPGPASVQKALKAEAPRGTSLIRVTATANDPQLAADLANVTAEEFVSYFRETNRASMAEVRKFTGDQLALARARLEASERALQAFKERRQMPSVSMAVNQIMAQVASTRSELDTAMLARRETEARLAAAQARLAQERPVVVSSRTTTDSPVFRRLQARLVDLEIQRLQMAQAYTPQHPRMEQIAKEVADVRDRLKAEAQTVVGEEVTASNPIHARLLGDIVSLEVQRAAVGARIVALDIAQRRLGAAAGTIPSAETEFNRVMRENRVLEGNYTTLSTRYQEILLRENQAGFFPASLQLIEAALPPVHPAPSPFPRTAAAALASGLVLGIAAAFVLESADGRIRSAQDAERALGVPVLAQIPVQGHHGRPIPATAVLIIALVLTASLMGAVVARGYVALPTGAALDGIRSMTGTITAWVNDLRAPGTR